jgi:hypothetical protein
MTMKRMLVACVLLAEYRAAITAKAFTASLQKLRAAP